MRRAVSANDALKGVGGGALSSVSACQYEYPLADIWVEVSKVAISEGLEEVERECRGLWACEWLALEC